VPKYPAFVGPSYESQSKIADGERTVNWYPEKIEGPGAKAQYALYPAPGFETFLTLATSGSRGFHTLNGRTFAVFGSTLYELTAGATSLTRGTGINDLDGTPAYIVGNGDAGNQIFVVGGSKGYLYDLNTNTFTQVLDGASKAAFLDGFFLALDPQTSTLKISALEDGSSWDAGDVAQRNAGSDRWSGMLVANREIWLFGSQTTEVWYNSGAAFPFTKNPSVFISHGILAPDSAAILDNTPIWLGQSLDGGGIVYRANGYQPMRVSNHALEYALSTYSTLADATAWTYQEQGHSFYILTFPTAGATWVYDSTTGLWHERGSWDGNRFQGVPVYGHTFAFGYHLVGSRTSGAVYRMASSLTTDVGGATMRRLRRAAHLSREGVRVLFDALEVHLEAGLGLASGQGSDPQIDLRWSDDGGQTWGNWYSVDAGAQGQYKTRAIWRCLGQARDRVFEVAVSDPIPWRLIDAYVTVRGCRS
jgi:hypothetical protein